jgi:benzylsuccinate CoA-transferase BbsF subunit
MSAKLPMAGIRVLDFTWGGAGPFATKALADHGAEVIKVETGSNYDFSRKLPPYAGGVKGVNRSAYFANRNSSKLSVTINLKKKGAVELTRRLIPHCDVVINNFRAGILEKLGFSYGQLTELRPDIIYVTMPLQGSSGPQAAYSGIGHTLNVLAGIYGLTGYKDGLLVGPGTNYPDHSVNPGHALVAVLGALIHRRRTGQGQYIEVSQLESTMNLLGPSILAYSLNRINPEPQGNESSEFAPYGVFPCTNGEWIAISVLTDAHWRGLCDVAGQQPWLADVRFKEAAQRLACANELKGIIASWTAQWDAFGLMKALQRAGVPAGVAQTAKDLVERDEQLAARGHLVTVQHPEMGPVVYNGIPYKLSRTPGRIGSAPVISEHNDRIFRGLLGLTDAEMAELRDSGVFE